MLMMTTCVCIFPDKEGWVWQDTHMLLSPEAAGTLLGRASHCAVHPLTLWLAVLVALVVVVVVFHPSDMPATAILISWFVSSKFRFSQSLKQRLVSKFEFTFSLFFWPRLLPSPLHLLGRIPKMLLKIVPQLRFGGSLTRQSLGGRCLKAQPISRALLEGNLGWVTSYNIFDQSNTNHSNQHI